MKVVALAGGVGGARLAHGLARCLPEGDLMVIVNTGDDFEHLGLAICPDLDTVCYTLAEIASPVTGWGRADESWKALETIARLGGPDWFRLGDRDLGWHLERTRRLQSGQPLSQVTRDFCQALGVAVDITPMSDDKVRTWVYTDVGELPFQEYFVRRRCEPRVQGFRFEGAEHSRPAPGIMEALGQADCVIICPSNPWVSVAPILAVPGLRAAAAEQRVVAVSPLIGGQAVKGPAAKMYTELGIDPSALAVARHYGDLLVGFVLDHVDAAQAPDVNALGVQTLVTDALMRDEADRQRLAQEVLDFAQTLAGGAIL